MKKRILALALVVVTLVLTLTGCAYRYDKKNLSKYATVDGDSLAKLIELVKIDGHDFGAFDENGDVARKDKVLEEIDEILAGKINSAKLASGNYGLHQKVTYAYYCTYVKDGVTYTYNTSNMNTASDKLQTLVTNPTYENGEATSTLKNDDALTVKIFEAINGKSVTEYQFTVNAKTATTTEIKAGDLALVTYSYSYLDEQGAKKTVNGTYAPLVAATADGTAKSIAELLGGKKISDIKATSEAPLKFMNGEVECSVNSISVHSVTAADKVKELTFDFELTAELKDIKDAYNDTEKVTIPKDEKVTYHVFPAEAKAVPAQTAQNVVELVYGENITTSSLPCFGDLGMKELIENVLELKEKFDTAESAYNKNKDSAELKKAKEDAEKAYDDALAALPEKLATAKSGAASVIMYDYKATVYDTLESEYDAEIEKQLTAAIWEWAKTGITVADANLPKAAIREAKDRILAGHKNTYYTSKFSPSGNPSGASASDAIPYEGSKQYPNLDAYLDKVAYASRESGTTVDAAVEAEAKVQVQELIRVHALAKHLGDKVDKVTNSDIAIYVDRLSAQMQSIYLQFGMTPPTSTQPKAIRETYGDTALRAALTMDNILGYLLQTELVDDTGATLPEDATDAQKNAAHIQYVNVKFAEK